MPVASLTRTQVRQNVGRTGGWLWGRRTFQVTAATFGSIAGSVAGHLDSLDLALSDAQALEGKWMYLGAGPGAGLSRVIVSTLVGSPVGVPSGTRLYPDRTMSFIPSTNNALELWDGIDPVAVNDFISDAVRAASLDLLDHHEDYAIQLDDGLGAWGSFERWTAGESSLPEGWSTSSGSVTVARDTSVVYSGKASAKLTGTAFVIETDDIPNYAKLAGETITAHAKLFVTSASRVRINIADGVTTSNSAFHDGSSGWEGDSDNDLSVEYTVSGSPTQLRVQIELATGASINFWAGKVYLDTGHHIYEYDLPEMTGEEKAFAYVSEVWLEDNLVKGTYTTRFPYEYWDIDRSRRPRKLLLREGLVEGYLTPGRGVRLVGQSHPRVPDADTDVLDVDPEYVRKAALLGIWDSMGWDDMSRSRRDRYEREVKLYLEQNKSHVYPDAVPTE